MGRLCTVTVTITVTVTVTVIITVIVAVTVTVIVTVLVIVTITVTVTVMAGYGDNCFNESKDPDVGALTWGLTAQFNTADLADSKA